MKLKLNTPAKINLGLFIQGKRPDGFHELETLLQMITLYDTLELEDQPSGITLEVDMPGIPADADNLAVRAARLLQDEVPQARDRGCHMRLQKRIPAGAGLGGGSGNAAGVLWGLNRLWDLRLERQALQELSARLGSDVPFFLCSPAALGRGRGELLTPLEASAKFHVIVVFPRISVSTAGVYGALNLDLTKTGNNISILQQFFSKSDIASVGAHLHNDLEPVVLSEYPVVQAVRNKLSSLSPEGVLVSGSGSSVFAVFEKPEKARQAHAEIREGDWDLFLTETVSSFSEFVPESLLDYP